MSTTGAITGETVSRHGFSAGCVSICRVGRPVVSALHLSPGRRLPMKAVEEVVVQAGHGITGDRYENSRHRHVTVQSADGLAAASQALGADVSPAGTRRNITLDHGEIPTTPGSRLRVGHVQLEVVRVAAPCRILDDEIAPGAAAALRRRAGSVCRTLRGGVIRLGDEVELGLPTLTVVPVSTDDAGVAELVAALTDELAAAGYAEDESFGYSLARLAASGVHLAGVRSEGELVGIGGLEIDTVGRTAELKRFYLSPGHRGTGAAGKLLSSLLDHARRGGVEVVRLETGDQQRAAMAFYRGHGFSEIPRFGPYVDSATSVCMARGV